MVSSLDPLLRKELGEAKAALARHGIVILRSVETELEPAIMVSVRDSLASSPARLRRMSDDELDRLMERARKAAMRSSVDLAQLHTHLLAKLATERMGDLVKELDGIDRLFRWDRIAKATEPVDALLERAGFGPVTLTGPHQVSEAFALELEQKWPPALKRFKSLAEEASRRLDEARADRAPPRRAPKKAKRTSKGKKTRKG